MAIYEIQNLSFTYAQNTTPTLSSINMNIAKGEFVLLFGSSGCGKSTFIRQLKKEITPYGIQKGTITYEGIPLTSVPTTKSVSEIGMVFQNPDNQIVMHSVYEELAFGMENLSFPPKEIQRRIAEIATFFGMNPWLYKATSELSGGQKQLLNLASVMTLHPKVLLLDEPTSQLDPLATRNFLNILKQLNEELSLTIIMSEHQLDEIFPIVDTVYTLKNGRVLYHFSPQKMIYHLYTKKEKNLYPYLPSVSMLYLHLSHSYESNNIPITPKEAKIWFDSQPLTFHSFDSPVSDSKIPMALSCKNLYFQYDKTEPIILENISLMIPKGKCIAILGSNGSGKSTFLKVLAGILTPLKGKIKTKEKIGYLSQNPMALFHEDTVYKQLQSATNTNNQSKLSSLVTFLGINHLLEKHPYDISGGEMQKVALAIILLSEPDILLLDEPTKGLDPAFKIQFATLLKELTNAGKTIIMVSHDMNFVATYTDFTSLMFSGNLLTLQPTKSFFASNDLYTTAIHRSVKEKMPNAITLEDVTSHVSY